MCSQIESCALRPAGSPRTLVMSLRAPSELWVFWPSAPNMGHEHAASRHSILLPPPAHGHRSGFVVRGFRLRRSSGALAQRSHCSLLLPMPRSFRPPRLHQDVRHQETRRAVACHHLHEAALPGPARQIRRRPTLPPPRSRRARPTVALRLRRGRSDYFVSAG
jgi:hypothetical protein